MTFSAVFAVRFVKEYTAYDVNLSGYSSQGKKAIRYFENIYEFNNDEILLDVLYSIGAATLWIRFLYMFRLTKFLGPLIKSVFLMMWDITIFMILFGIILIIYSAIGTLMFYAVPQYSDFWTSLVTLFGSALGNFDLTILNEQNKGQFMGEIYLISFMILSYILVLNLLIAILTSTYSDLSPYKLVLYINEILKLRSSLEYNKKASGLLSAFPPWNVFPLLLSPFYFMLGNSKRLNLVVFHICYVPVLCLTTVVFSLLNIFLMPVSYVKSIIIKIQFLFNKKVETSFKKRLFSLTIYLCFGMGITVLNFFVDLYFFVLHMYQKDIKFRREASKCNFVHSEYYYKLYNKFTDDSKAGKEVVSFLEMSLYARSAIDVENIVSRMVYGDFKQNNPTCQLLTQINQYSKVGYLLFFCRSKTSSTQAQFISGDRS